MFGTPQQINAQEENTPIWLLAPLNINEGEFFGNIMRDPRNVTTCSPQADLLQEIYGKMDYEDVQSAGMKQNKVALVDDCAFEGDNQRFRLSPGPLTAYELYRLLREPRFHIEYANNLTIGDTTGTVPHATCTTNLELAEHDRSQPDADRRLIYLTDLDKWSALALLATVSRLQMEPLRHVLYRHVAAEAYIDIAICPDDVFELAFHLPFRAWRPRDGGEPVPGVTDVSFLDWDGDCPGSLHKAMYSCSVAGSDEWHWVAYCFVDTHFQGCSEDQESPEDRYEYMRELGSFRLDPCGNMSFTNDKTGPNPRYWFLSVLEARLAMVDREWRNVARQVQRSIERYSQEHLSESHSSEHGFTRAVVWTNQIQPLIAELSCGIAKTLYACDRFLEGHADEFDDEPGGVRHTRIIEIDQHAESLHRVQNHLEAMRSICDVYASNLSLHMDVDQKVMARDNRSFSAIVLLICTPVLLTSGILSMEDNVLQQTIPKFLTAPGMFYKILALTAATLFGAALQQKLVIFPVQQMLEVVKAALRALPHDLRWLRRLGPGAAVPAERSLWTFAPEDFEFRTSSRPRPYLPWRQTTMTLGGPGDAESPTRPRRALLPGRYLRSNTS